MRLAQIDGFLAVVEHGSIRAAARAMGLSQPALSKSISMLERDLGCSLLGRDVTGAVPTEIGRAFLLRAHAIRSDLQRAKDEIAQLRGMSGGRITIGTSAAPAFAVVPQAVVALQLRNPGAFVRMVEIIYPAAIQGLRDGSLDLAVGPVPARLADVGSEIQVTVLYRNRVLLAVRRGHPLATARSLRELGDAEWIRAGTPEGPARVVDEAFARAGLPGPRYRVQCESVLALAELAAASDFVAVVPQQVLAREGASDRLLNIRVAERIEPVQIALFTRARPPLTPMARELVQLLRDQIRRMHRQSMD